MKRNIALTLLVVLFLSSCFGLVSVSAQEPGYLTVLTEPIPGKIYVDGVYVGEGYYPPTEKPPGTYKVSFGELEGYMIPPMQMATVTSNETTSVRVTYEPLPYPTTTGTISVTTTPVSAKIFIDGKYVGTGSCTQEYLLGTYTVRFDAVECYITPASETVILTVEGEKVSVVGSYKPIVPPPTPQPEPTPQPDALAPIIQLYSTRTTVTLKQPGLLTISAVNIMGNPVMTAETIFTVDPGVEVMGVGTPFVSSGAGQYLGKFIVLPEEEKHFTVSVRALKEDLTSFTVKATTYYYWGDDVANRQMVQNTITFDVQPPPTPIAIPTPVPTPVPTSESVPKNVSEPEPTPEEKSPGFEAVLTIAVLSAVAYLIRKRK